MNIEPTTTQPSTEPRFKSGTEWLAWRRDYQRGQQEILAARAAELLALENVLSVGGHHRQADPMPWTYGVETIYKVTLRDLETTLESRVEVKGVFGTASSMTPAEREEHFRRQIDGVIATLRRNVA